MAETPPPPPPPAEPIELPPLARAREALERLSDQAIRTAGREIGELVDPTRIGYSRAVQDTALVRAVLIDYAQLLRQSGQLAADLAIARQQLAEAVQTLREIVAML